MYAQLRWFKNTTRRDEVKMLMQGLSIPDPTTCASSPLPPHRDTQPPPPSIDPFELDDTTGKAVVRVFNPQTQRQPPPPPPVDPVDEFNADANENVGATIQTVSKSRTSEWRERKRQQVAAGNPGPTKKARKQYCCRVCGQVQSTG
jgi:hypothetical protein